MPLIPRLKQVSLYAAVVTDAKSSVSMWTTLVLLFGLAPAFGHGRELNIQALIDELNILRPRQLGEIMKIAERHYDEPPVELSGVLSQLSGLFIFSPSANALLAIFLLSAVTSLVLAVCPPLSESASSFLVAFALGSMLGSIWLHSVVEITEVSNPRFFGLIVTLGFCFFVAVDKLVRLKRSDTNSSAHQHYHSHSIAEAPAAAASESEKVLRQRKSKTKDKKKVSSEPDPILTNPRPDTGMELAAVLNIAADTIHNITEGIYVSLAFHRGAVTGSFAVTLLALHELPHQFGDFALLLKGGIDRPTAIKAQILALSGMWIGVIGSVVFDHLAYSRQWPLVVNILGSSLEFTEIITPLTTGVFLYVATVGILPEVMSPDGGISRTLLQAGGITVGLALTYALGE